ncbi:Hypothetical protein AJAP_42455 (plasmid) [Amycolatopsis japonica]|uniref:Uncharacterized protein n=1 Tax=Amycolatopsis japonica TaxID=208439 RepID=A0A075V4F9_9PSEU|nr:MULTISPECIES: hypothetical protein [Amycolatopsis]AIG81262.1 Hypothetical protein AJAP_42455 [Amycolatopsis japonica]RSN38574.1 hypothetical protein DMC64_41645 [Amycolatopsis sp. WAC 04197]
MNYLPHGRLVWSRASSGISSTLTATTTSKEFSLREFTDLWLSVSVDSVAGDAPTLDVSLEIKGAGDKWFPAGLAAPQLTAAGTAQAAGGLHHATKPLVLPERGRLVFTVGGTTPNLQGVAVALYGR